MIFTGNLTKNVDQLTQLGAAPFKELGRFGKDRFDKYNPTTDTFANYFGRFIPINVLYENPMSKAGQMAPARIGRFILFGQTSEKISLANRIPSHPLPEGSQVSDHVYAEPITISVEGLVTEINSNILEQAWYDGQLQSTQGLIKELRKGGMSTVDAIRRVTSGYQKRKHIVDLLYEIMQNKGDFRYTYSSNLATYTHMAITSLEISQDGDDKPLAIAFELSQVKSVKIGTVGAGYFLGAKRKPKTKNTVGEGAEDIGGSTASTVIKCKDYLSDGSKVTKRLQGDNESQLLRNEWSQHYYVVNRHCLGKGDVIDNTGLLQ